MTDEEHSPHAPVIGVQFLQHHHNMMVLQVIKYLEMHQVLIRNLKLPKLFFNRLDLSHVVGMLRRT